MGTKESIVKLVTLAVMGVIQPASADEVPSRFAPIPGRGAKVSSDGDFVIQSLPTGINELDLSRFPILRDEERSRRFLEVISPEGRRDTLRSLLEKSHLEHLTPQERRTLLQITIELRASLGQNDPPAPG